MTKLPLNQILLGASFFFTKRARTMLVTTPNAPSADQMSA